ncbi:MULTISPECIES: polysaccharide biosynthesis/export family protein [Sphingobium]|uniref:Sugar transporter n=1 Tax=Sphingobium chungbukense TaxID=56193 RepID=A0A0M3AV06_9SPHN|nr:MULTISPECIES: polysaccharide biosynthesis/export family protein [Sphingobium]KKW93670.1 sugar transporter [Sphingobium chungbukense]PJG48145.1 sugar transporter [Sphingobium sp. LB126]
MRNRLYHGLFLGLFAVTAACSGGPSGLASLPPAPTVAYRLGAGDEVRVAIPGLTAEDPGSSSYTINDRGQISLPILGDVDASGKTVPELQLSIAQQLTQRQLLNAPTVSVQPVRLRPFYVLGEVKSPGEYQYRAGMSVLAAVSVAGGYTFRAEQGNVAITRMVDGRQVVGRASERDMIQPGDTVRIYEKWF